MSVDTGARGEAGQTTKRPVQSALRYRVTWDLDALFARLANRNTTREEARRRRQITRGILKPTHGGSDG